MPKLGASAGWSYVKMTRRAQDWATVGGRGHRRALERLDREGRDRAHEHGRDAAAGARRPRRRSRAAPSIEDAATMIAEGTEPADGPRPRARTSACTSPTVLGKRALEEAAAR